jgi:hypothetical protein
MASFHMSAEFLDIPQQIQAMHYIESHGHFCHVFPGYIVAESLVTFPGTKRPPMIEYGTFMAPYSAREIRDWLGY